VQVRGERYRQAKTAADMMRRGDRKEGVAEARAKLAGAKGQLEEVKVRLREMEVRTSGSWLLDSARASSVC
jgi:hypothetical protein